MAKFYNLADQKLFEKYQFLPQEQYRLGLNLPTDPDPVVDEGIVNTNAFANSGGGSGDGFNAAGNMFGEGTAVNPVYGSTPITGGLGEAGTGVNPITGDIVGGGNIVDEFGTKGEVYSKGAFDGLKSEEEKKGFLSRMMNSFRQKTSNLPDWVKTGMTAAQMLNPLTAIPALLSKFGGSGPQYGIAGLTDQQKNLYDNLAANNYLFNTPGGMKTFDGKNFSKFDDDTINDYFSDKIDKYGSIEEYEDYLNDPTISKVDPKKTNAEMRKNLTKTLQFYKTAKKGSDDFTNFNENINAGNDPTNTYDYGITQGVSNADYTGGGSLDRAIDNARARSDAQDDGPGGGTGGYSGAGEDANWGGGEKDGGFIDGTNRRPFAYGGLASIL